LQFLFDILIESIFRFSVLFVILVLFLASHSHLSTGHFQVRLSFCPYLSLSVFISAIFLMIPSQGSDCQSSIMKKQIFGEKEEGDESFSGNDIFTLSKLNNWIVNSIGEYPLCCAYSQVRKHSDNWFAW